MYLDFSQFLRYFYDVLSNNHVTSFIQTHFADVEIRIVRSIVTNVKRNSLYGANGTTIEIEHSVDWL